MLISKMTPTWCTLLFFAGIWTVSLSIDVHVQDGAYGPSGQLILSMDGTHRADYVAEIGFAVQFRGTDDNGYTWNPAEKRRVRYLWKKCDFQFPAFENDEVLIMPSIIKNFCKPMSFPTARGKSNSNANPGFLYLRYVNQRFMLYCSGYTIEYGNDETIVCPVYPIPLLSKQIVRVGGEVINSARLLRNIEKYRSRTGDKEMTHSTSRQEAVSSTLPPVNMSNESDGVMSWLCSWSAIFVLTAVSTACMMIASKYCLKRCASKKEPLYARVNQPNRMTRIKGFFNRSARTGNVLGHRANGARDEALDRKAVPKCLRSNKVSSSGPRFPPSLNANGHVNFHVTGDADLYDDGSSESSVLSLPPRPFPDEVPHFIPNGNQANQFNSDASLRSLIGYGNRSFLEKNPPARSAIPKRASLYEEMRQADNLPPPPEQVNVQIHANPFVESTSVMMEQYGAFSVDTSSSQPADLNTTQYWPLPRTSSPNGNGKIDNQLVPQVPLPPPPPPMTMPFLTVGSNFQTPPNRPAASKSTSVMTGGLLSGPAFESELKAKVEKMQRKKVDSGESSVKLVPSPGTNRSGLKRVQSNRG